MVGIWFPISTFVAIGFEHSVANLFLLPLGTSVASSSVVRTRATAFTTLFTLTTLTTLTAFTTLNAFTKLDALATLTTLAYDGLLAEAHSLLPRPRSPLPTPQTSLLTPLSPFLTPHSSLLTPHPTPHSSLPTSHSSLLNIATGMLAKAKISFFDIMFKNLIPVTIGNAIAGALIVGAGYSCKCTSKVSFSKCE